MVLFSFELSRIYVSCLVKRNAVTSWKCRLKPECMSVGVTVSLVHAGPSTWSVTCAGWGMLCLRRPSLHTLRRENLKTHVLSFCGDATLTSLGDSNHESQATLYPVLPSVTPRPRHPPPRSISTSTSRVLRFIIHHPDDGGSTHLWNISLHQRDYTALYPISCYI
jgi:hypothetical protein